MRIATDLFRRVLGNYATGVAIITALGAERRPVGMVVGTLTSVSLDPPLIGFLPDRKSTSWPQIEAAGQFCANVLAVEQMEVCRQFASSHSERFDRIEYTLSQRDLPIIAGSNVRIECSLHSVSEAGDHWFVLGHVLDLEVTGEADPLLFHRGRYGSFAGRP